MAKEKIRKLLRDKDELNKKINSLAGMLALMASKNGGEIVFTQEELQSIPNASFSIDITDGVYVLKLTYDDAAMTRLAEHKAAADKMEAELQAA